MPPERLIIKTEVESTLPASEFLAGKTGLSKTKIKDAMNKGAAWLKRGRGALRRIRKAALPLRRGDLVEFYYDEQILSLSPERAECLEDLGHYSVWLKPAGLLSQGTRFGDHCSLLREAELSFHPRRELFLVHRLDREVSGLMVLAHSRRAASLFSGMFREGRVEKKYRAELRGEIAKMGETGAIDLPLDGKPSRTEYRLISYDRTTDRSVVEARLITGRLHQIRRHFDAIGFPVIGDPRYGKGNKNREGLRLSAILLQFRCPFQGAEREFSIHEEKTGSLK